MGRVISGSCRFDKKVMINGSYRVNLFTEQVSKLSTLTRPICKGVDPFTTRIYKPLNKLVLHDHA